MSGVTKKLRKNILHRDGYRCQKCGRDNGLDVHHIVASSDNGTDDLNNLITLCIGCHREWEAVECTSNFEFKEWLKFPCITRLLASLFESDIPEKTSAREFINKIMQIDKLYRNSHQ